MSKEFKYERTCYCGNHFETNVEDQFMCLLCEMDEDVQGLMDRDME